MHLNEFLSYIANTKRLSEKTIIAYQNDLQQFFNFLIKEDFDCKNESEISSSAIRAWIVSLMQDDYENKSVNRKISSLKSYFKFLLQQKIVGKNPMVKISSPKNKKQLPQFVEEPNMKFLFEELPFGTGYKSLLDRTILETLYCTGMRLSEIINLKIENVDFSLNSLKITGKGNKTRIVPMTDKLRKSLAFYFEERKIFEQEKQHFFVNEKQKKLYPKYIYRLCTHYISLVSTIQKRSPHVVRHTFATHLLNNGADLNAIKELLGHASLAATQVYAHNSIEKLKNIHHTAHPRG